MNPTASATPTIPHSATAAPAAAADRMDTSSTNGVVISSSPSAAAPAASVSSSTATTSACHDFLGLPPADRIRCTQYLHESTLRRTRQQYPESLLAYEKLLALCPGYVPAWNGKGLCYRLMKDHVSALQCFQRALALDPKDWNAHDNLGQIFKETELFERAMESYKLAIEFGPATGNPAREHLAVVLTDYGTRLKLAGSTERAVQSYNDALEVHDAYWPAYFNLGVVYSERREFDRAMKHYQLAIDRNPNYVEALCNIGVIYKNSGDLALAIEYYERALRANANFAIANSNLSIACLVDDTLLRTNTGKVKRIDQVTCEMKLMGQNGEEVEIEKIQHGLAQEMIQIRYGDEGQHLVTRNHLVTLHWNASPRVEVHQHQQIPMMLDVVLVWYERDTLEMKSQHWIRPAHTSSDLSSSPSSSQQHDDPSSHTTFALDWLHHSESHGLTHPLQSGDLIDIRADQLLELQHDLSFMQCVGIPIFTAGLLKLTPASFPSSTSLLSLSPSTLSASTVSKTLSTSISCSPIQSITCISGFRKFVAITLSSSSSSSTHPPRFLLSDSSITHNCTDMGTQVKNEGRLDEGIQYYKKALGHHSKYPAAWYNLGVAYAEKCRFDSAKVCYEMAVLFDNKCAEAYNNLGVIYKDRGNLDQAIHYYGLALNANSKFSQTMNNCGVIYTMLGKLDEAHDYCSRAIKTNPLYAEAHNNLGVLYRDEGRISEAIASYEECLKIDPLSRNAGQNRLLAMNSISRTEDTAEFVAQKVWEAHQQWGIQFAKLYQKERYEEWNYIYETNETSSSSSSSVSSSSSIPRSLALRRPLRIGYISADFFTHSVSYFIEAPLAYADRNITHVTCYSNVARRDKKTQHLQNLAHAWRAIHDQTAKQVAQMIRQDKIDILVELTGHTAGNRLDVLALKPAPICVTWIGYPNTTGLPMIDYRFTDEIVDPFNTKQMYSEELLRLNGPFLCYTPPSDAPPVSPTPALSKGYITFGSFNNLAKVNDQVLTAWCRILHSVPNSRMLIKCKPFASQTVCKKMWKRFTEFGIDSERVDLVSLLPTTSEHLDSYSNVDISVDTYPYAGTTTTCEALFCGVPVVTYQCITHPNHAHNVGASLLARIDGMKELIATSEEEYVNIAVKLAQDLPKLQSLRSSLRPAMMASTLCNGKQFVANLTKTYEEIWTRYVQQQQQQQKK